MNGAKLSEEELYDLIVYAIKANNLDINGIKNHKINRIIGKYTNLCIELKQGYVIGKLDTFKRAACLLIAINNGGLTKFKQLNASIAVEAAYKMCEKPYWNVGPHHDEPKKLEEVDFNEVFQDNMEVLNKSKSMMIDSLIYEGKNPLSYELTLQLLYEVALQQKHKNVDNEPSDNGAITRTRKIEK